jgi:DNA-binding transcriptional MerR regulator
MSVEAGLTIADAARASGVSAYTLRYYERAGLIDDVSRGRFGPSPLQRPGSGVDRGPAVPAGDGMPIRTIRPYAELVRAGEGNELERLALLREHRREVRAQLAEVRRHLAFIDRKISFCEDTLDE